MNKPLPPTLSSIKLALKKLDGLILQTPIWQWRSKRKDELLGGKTDVFLKLELLQHTGCFKPRGALTVILNASEKQKQHGVVAVSAGNHAIAVSYAAKALGLSAKVVINKAANPLRIQQCRQFGAEVILAENIQQAFILGEEIAKQEKRLLVHPFDGPFTTLGQATLGLEFCEQVSDLDAIIVAIGGGGLISGVASAVKAMQPNCKIYGVEPEGADTMHRSFKAGKPISINKINTIADSLGAPYAMQYSFDICRQTIDELVMINDDQIREAMQVLFEDLKMAIEPAGAAVLAALMHPLKEKLRGKRVGLVICGSNIDITTFCRLFHK